LARRSATRADEPLVGRAVHALVGVDHPSFEVRLQRFEADEAARGESVPLDVADPDSVLPFVRAR